MSLTPKEASPSQGIVHSLQTLKPKMFPDNATVLWSLNGFRREDNMCHSLYQKNERT
jgi:hypothetical protein